MLFYSHRCSGRGLARWLVPAAALVVSLVALGPAPAIAQEQQKQPQQEQPTKQEADRPPLEIPEPELAPEHGAAKPAVDGVNGAIVGGYGYEEIASGTTAGGSTFVPANETKLPEVAGVLTFPIGFGFGGRVLASGTARSTQHPAEGSYPGGVENGYLVDAGFDLFARNPDSGFFGVGYRFRWGDPAEGGADQLLANGLNAAGGFFIPDQGMGPIDWRASFTWLRGTAEGPGFSEDADDFSGEASSGWYLTDSLRFTGLFRWSLDRPAASLDARDLRGGADLAWLLPFGSRRYVTLGATGTGGKARLDLPAAGGSVDRTAWSVGGRVMFNFPGAASLVELTRERL